MTITLKNLNALPVRTWNRLHINDTAFDEVVPNITPLTLPFEPKVPEGLHLLPDAPGGFPDMDTSMGPHAAGFVRQWANAGLALRAPENGGSQQPVVICYRLGKADLAVVDNNTLLAEPNSRLTLVQVYESTDGARAFHAGLTRILAKAGSFVRLVQIQLLNDKSAHWNDVGVVADEGASVELVQIELGADRALCGGSVLLRGAKSAADIRAFYLGDGSRSLDFNYKAKHLGTETHSEIDASGALFDRCEKICRCSIDFVSGAARSVGHERENTLLFSPECVNRSAPLILCGEENVEGQHAATIGRVDADLMFYLNSRGITEKQARHLLVQAQLASALKAVPDEALAARVQAVLAERMEGL